MNSRKEFPQQQQSQSYQHDGSNDSKHNSYYINQRSEFYSAW
jgi:hypothetical protein